MAENKLAKAKVGDQVIARVEQLNQVGFIMPKDYNFVNAIKASLLVLQDLKDKNNKPALETCTESSIQKALFKMATKGLDASKKTCYFIVRGNQLCLDDSYFGKVLQVKRIYKNFDPHPVVIHEGDEFTFEVDSSTGCRKIVKHEQKFENLDKDFIGAYIYLPTADGGQDLYMMTKKQILAAWSQSPSQQAVHKKFTEKMICKTIINSGCNMIINSTPDLSFASDSEEHEEETHQEQKQIADFQEAEFVEEVDEGKAEVVDTETGEIKQEEEEF